LRAPSLVGWLLCLFLVVLLKRWM